MARKLTNQERSEMTFARSSSINVPDEWLDGDVWALESEDFAPHTPEIARQLIRTVAQKRGKKIATKIREGVLYIQVVPEAANVVELDRADEDAPVPPEEEEQVRGRRGA